jgi:mono/diheme cytochrome c family protein
MEKNFDKVICLMRFGTRGELIVNGVQFNQPMPGVAALSDLEIAEISTYIYNTWEHARGLADVKKVSKILESCKVQ